MIVGKVITSSMCKQLQNSMHEISETYGDNYNNWENSSEQSLNSQQEFQVQTLDKWEILFANKMVTEFKLVTYRYTTIHIKTTAKEGTHYVMT